MQGRFRNIDLRQTPLSTRRPQAIAAPQAIEAQITPAQVPLQVALHAGQIVAAGGHMQAVHHDPGGLLRFQLLQKISPDPPPCLTGQQVLQQLGTQQGAGFSAQTLDQMAEVDPPQWAPVAPRPVQTLQRHHEVAAEEQVQTVVAQVDIQLLADEPRRHAVGDLPHLDRAGAPHPRHRCLVVRVAVDRHRPQLLLLDPQLLLHRRPPVEALAHPGHQGQVLRLRLELPAAALEQLLCQSPLEVGMGPLDRPVLMGHPLVVAGGDQAEMGAEFAVAAGVDRRSSA